MKYSDNDRLDCLIRLAYMKCDDRDVKLFDSTDGTEQPVPKKLDAKIKRLIKRGGRVDSYATAKKIFVRAAVAAMLVMSVLFIFLISVSGIREAIWKAVVEWYDDYITISYSAEAPENDGVNLEDSAPGTDENKDESMSDVEQNEENKAESSSESDTTSSTEDNTQSTKPTPPTKIEEIRKPTYVLDGVVEDVFVGKSGVIADYFMGNDMVYSFSQHVLKENEKYFDSEGATVGIIYVNDYEASLVTYINQDDVAIVWNDKEYVYVLTSSKIEIEEMIKIAESVRAE